MKDFKDVIILVLISVFAGVCLSLVYTATKDKIEEARQREIEKAVKKVLPFMKTPHIETDFEYQDESFKMYVVEENGSYQGAALSMTTPEGFSGNITFLMGVDRDDSVTGFYLLKHKETPGLGTKAADKKFYGQFLGKNLGNFKFKVTKDGGQVEAITAATITSRAVTHAMEKGLRIIQDYKSKRGGA